MAAGHRRRSGEGVSAVGHGTSLTAFQIEVAQRFFAAPEAGYYVLAGAAGLAAQGLIARPTKDLDLFTTDLTMSVQPASAAIKRLGDALAWTVVVEDEITTDTFCRMMITRDLDAARVAIDLAVDVSPRRAPTRHDAPRR